MTPVEELLVGLAELLSSAGIGSWSGQAGELVDVDTPSIVVGGRVPNTPHRVIRIAAYMSGSRDYSTATLVGVQVTVRGKPHDVPDFATVHAVEQELHGLRAVTLGTYPNQRAIVQCLMQSVTDIGLDAVGRLREVMNFYVHMDIGDLDGKTG